MATHRTTAEQTHRDLVHEAERLARAVAGGWTDYCPRLAEVCRELARRSGAQNGGPTPDSEDPAVDLMRRVSGRPLALPAWSVRSANRMAHCMSDRDWLAGYGLSTLPDPLPEADDTLVVVYKDTTPGVGSLLHEARKGDEQGAQTWVDEMIQNLAPSTG